MTIFSNFLNEDNFHSVFDLRKRYFAADEPQGLGRGNTIFFVMKNRFHEYEVVGTAKPTMSRKVGAGDRDEMHFSEEHGWPQVIELADLEKCLKRIPVAEVFSSDILGKIHSQRPFGIELTRQESKSAKERIHSFLQGYTSYDDEHRNAHAE